MKSEIISNMWNILWGHRRKPHNSILGIAYTYGVFAAVPYIIMLIATIERTFRYSRRNMKYSSVPFYVCLSLIMMSLSDNVEQPFVWLPWIGLYFMMGIVFDNSQLLNLDRDEQKEFTE